MTRPAPQTCVLLSLSFVATVGASVGAAVGLASCGDGIEGRAFAQPPATPNAFDPNSALPDPTTAEVRKLLDAGNAMDARAAVEQALPNADPALRGRLLWLAASASRTLKDDADAVKRYRSIAATNHPLARWATLRVAESLVGKEDELALALLETVLDDWPGRSQAEVLKAKALLATRQTDAGVALLRDLVARTRSDSGAVLSAMPLAQELATHDSVEDRAEAVVLYRRIATRLPGTGAGNEAESRIKELLATLPPKRRAALASPTGEELMALADAYARSRRYKDAEKTYLRAAKELKDAAKCEAELEAARAVYTRREREAAAKQFDRLRKGCKSDDALQKSRYLAGRSYALIGNYAEAIARYDELVGAAPSHYLADDALLRSALSALEKGDGDAFVERLERLVAEMPNGDMVPDARLLLGRTARARGDHERALEHFEALVALNVPPSEDAWGQPSYWRARTLEALGRKDEASYAYEQLALSFPLAYYAQLAVARLREIAPDKANTVLTSWRGSTAEPLRLPWREVYERPAFERALELFRVGELDLAERELDGLGALGSKADAPWVWVTAALYDRAGATPNSITILRRRQSLYRSTAPFGRGYAEWRLAYPKAFYPLIDETAAGQGIPASFIRAVAREESSFNPRAVSPARAYGLIQVILPTAKRWGGELGLRVTPETLKQPEVNVPTGTRFVKYLWDRYSANTALVPSAYNAGNGATDRWLKERPDQSLDEWIDDIPYDETRGYTRRVLQSWGIYQWLESGTLPELKMQIK